VERIGESPRRGFLALASAVFFARKARELYGPVLDRGKHMRQLREPEDSGNVGSAKPSR